MTHFLGLPRLLLGAVAALIFCCTLSMAQQKAPSRAEVVEQLRNGNNQQAVSLADQALKASPRDCPLRSLRAVALTALGQMEPALQSFKRALADCPAYLPALEGAAQIEFAQQGAETTALLNRILSQQPENATAHSMLASILRSQNNCPEAVPHYEASKLLFPSRPDLLEGYGLCLAKSGDLKAALAQYLNLLASNPNDRVRYDVALLQWKTHANEDALSTLAPLLEQGRDEAAFTLASKLCEEKGDTPRAVDLLRSAILIAPDLIDNYLDFVDIAYNHKSFQVGIDMVNEGLQRIPQSAPLYLARGVLEVQLSQGNAAVADFELAHRLDPALSLAIDAIGILETQQHQPAQTLALFHSQAKLHPDDALLQYLLAEQLSESGTEAGLAEAVAAAKRAATLEPGYKAAHDLLAVLYVRTKQPQLAIAQAELALALDPDDQDALYQEILATRRSAETSRLTALVARLNALRKDNEKKQQNLDRYR
jgi:tetratricopeptide (TPR) repeat protein